jgi:preprotein translocase subunit SecA
MLKKFIRIIGGDPNKREVEKDSLIVDQISDLEAAYTELSNDQLTAKTKEFRQRLSEGETLDELIPEAFAAVREASKRTIGLRHYDVQMIGGIALHEGKIAEMRTGEGKTLVATLPIYLNALTARGSHLITVNDYLARRDARWMAPIYNLLGLSVGVLQMASRTENGKKAFIVDLNKESPHEDQHQLRLVPRREAYAADITYGTNSEFGFDYLRDNMTMRLEDRVQRGHYYAIIDEVDNVLIDEARTPLIISGPAQDEAEWYIKMAQVVKNLRPEDYEISERDRTVSLTEIGESHVEDLLGATLRDPERPEDVTLEQARLLGYLEQALRAQFLFKRNKEYLVQSGKVIIVDEFTGRMMPGRRWSDGLHQAVEAKEGVRVQSESVTYATITIQNYFRMYDKLAGMSGTAVTEAEEFDKIYKLGVLTIPTNLEYQAMRSETGLVEVEEKDEQGYKYRFYTRKEDKERTPLYYRRKDYPDIVYRTEETKLRSIVREILFYHALGRPVLVGTTSVELSERVSGRMRAEPLRRLVQVMLLRESWLVKNNREDDLRIIPELEFMNQPLEQIDSGEMRRLAREINISFNPEDPENLARLGRQISLPSMNLDRLAADLAAGIPHQVLNARKHTEESQIIAGAGAFGAVTIATNMAGRGVDIKLGGELAEEILAGVNRVLNKAGFRDPYDMTMEERADALRKLSPADYSIYEIEIQYFLNHMREMELVRALGGLHVIGSERHDARRIDNQLRGRAARQGDPGSSRFYLSMEDELMRRTGGAQADSLMQRWKIDDSLPLEMGMVGKIIEQSQTQMEGRNFDTRKHLLEYDDVLNTQRASIYSQRNRIFTKEDLTEDVRTMLVDEVQRRVAQAFGTPKKGEAPREPWKLLAWLQEVQPVLQVGPIVYPSYLLRLLLNQLERQLPGQIEASHVRQLFIELAEKSLDAEMHHHLDALDMILDQSQERLADQIQDRMDALDTFLEGLDVEDETQPARKSSELAADLQNAARIQLKLSPDQLRQLKDDPEQVVDQVREQVETSFRLQAIGRIIGAVERRLGDGLELNVTRLADEEWEDIGDALRSAVETLFERRIERYTGEGGSITKDIDSALSNTRWPIQASEGLRPLLIHLLRHLPQGTRAVFDKRTHRRTAQHTTRLNYVFHAGALLENRDGEEVEAEVFEHLQEAQKIMQRTWGLSEINRLGNLRLAELEESVRQVLHSALEEQNLQPEQNLTINALPREARDVLVGVLGRRSLTGLYRQLLLSVISNLWIEYLTQMEGLRVAIGLEAYAQRDPLVQYKNRAFELYQNLLINMRQEVVKYMFTYSPRDLSTIQAGVSRNETPQVQQAVADAQDEQPDDDSVAEVTTVANTANPKTRPEADAGKKKRNRRR